MERCTVFCQKLHSITLQGSRLPAYEDLILQLNFDQEAREAGQPLGVWQEVSKRHSCPFCNLVTQAVRDRTEPDGITVNHNQPIRVLLFPGETSFRLSYPSALGTRLSFVTDSETCVVAPDCSRPIPPGPLQPAQLTRWLKKCDEEHDCYLNAFKGYKPANDGPSKRWSFDERRTSNFRVIDVVAGHLVEETLDVPYVALSYVWGQLPMFMLRKTNLNHLSTPGGLDEIWAQLPPTITDAIALVRAMDIQYLWVDALCLIQDDPKDVALGIELMNSIYADSYFNIIASSGHDAAAGLPGLNSRTRAPHTAHLRPDLHMTVAHGIDRQLSTSIYNQRGWTLQELVLSRRALVFTPEQVHFRCQQANWSEGSWSGACGTWRDPDDSNIARVPDVHEGWLPSLWAYQKLCEDFSRRKLWHDGDALRAVAGVCRPLLAGMMTPAADGLPAYYLDHFLLFVSSGGKARRRAQFASYSWAGWEGTMMWPRESYMRFEDGKVESDPSNIVSFFYRDTLLQWGMVGLDGSVEVLSKSEYKDTPLWVGDFRVTSRLGKFMRSFPDIFAAADAKRADKVEDMRFGGWRSSSGIPDWERRALEKASAGDAPNGPETLDIKVLNLANSEAEFGRLTRGMMDELCLRLLEQQNWVAMRRARLSEYVPRDRTGASHEGPVSVAKRWERDQYKIRGRVSDSVFGNDESLPGGQDARPSAAKRSVEYYAAVAHPGGQATIRQDAPSSASDSEAADAEDGGVDEEATTWHIPDFPPYAILRTQTIVFSLILGQAPTNNTSAPSNGTHASGVPSYFDRIPGTPLLTATETVVGSLHPDNIDLLGEPGSTVELMVLSRCQIPTHGSALATDAETQGTSSQAQEPRDLLWVLYIVWNKGIAERRGVGQVMTSSLRESVGSSPQLKLVYLG